MTSEELLKEVDSVKYSITDIGEKPDLISFYKKYSSSFNKAVMEMVLTPKGLKIVKASNNISDIMGFSSEELKGRYIKEFRQSPFDVKVLQQMLVMLDNNEVITKNNNILKKDGSKVHIRGILFKDGNKYVEFIWDSKNEFDLG
jgi:PAS domain S-box-containing protein